MALVVAERLWNGIGNIGWDLVDAKRFNPDADARYEQKNGVSLTGDGPSATQDQEDSIRRLTEKNRAFIAQRVGAKDVFCTWAEGVLGAKNVS